MRILPVFVVFLLMVSVAGLALRAWHPADYVAAGTFGSGTGNGNYTFPESLFVTGNVGIGTSVPSQKLHVAGNAYVSGNVGIGTTNPLSTLSVGGAGASGYAGYFASGSYYTYLASTGGYGVNTNGEILTSGTLRGSTICIGSSCQTGWHSSCTVVSAHASSDVDYAADCGSNYAMGGGGKCVGGERLLESCPSSTGAACASSGGLTRYWYAKCENTPSDIYAYAVCCPA